MRRTETQHTLTHSAFVLLSFKLPSEWNTFLSGCKVLYFSFFHALCFHLYTVTSIEETNPYLTSQNCTRHFRTKGTVYPYTDHRGPVPTETVLQLKQLFHSHTNTFCTHSNRDNSWTFNYSLPSSFCLVIESSTVQFSPVLSVHKDKKQWRKKKVFLFFSFLLKPISMKVPSWLCSTVTFWCWVSVLCVTKTQSKRRKKKAALFSRAGFRSQRSV